MNLRSFTKRMTGGTSDTAWKFLGANGQGKTKEECRTDLACAIALILKDRREDGMRSTPYGTKPETIGLPDALPEGEYTVI